MGAVCVRALRPGLSEEMIRAALRREGLGASAQVLAWFEWCNGSAGAGTFGQSRLFKGFWPIDLAEALRTRPDLGEFDRLGPRDLPIAENGAGDYLTVDCGLHDGPVIRNAKDDDPIQIYDSIERMVDTLSEAIARGAVTVEADGSLDFDFDEYGEVARTLNPMSPFWSNSEVDWARR